MSKQRTPEEEAKRREFFVSLDGLIASIGLGCASYFGLSGRIDVAIFWMLVAIFAQMPPRRKEQ